MVVFRFGHTTFFISADTCFRNFIMIHTKPLAILQFKDLFGSFPIRSLYTNTLYRGENMSINIEYNSYVKK